MTVGFDGDILSFLTIFLQVIFIDLLLSGDNAVVIALACRSLPPQWIKKAIFFGTAAAVVLRLIFAAIVAWLLGVPYLKLVAAAALLVIAVKLTALKEKEDSDPADAAAKPAVNAKKGLWSAMIAVIVADAAMSLDNVLALVAAAKGSLFFLGLGLAISVPLLMFGSLFVTKLLKRYPLLIPAGGALLGWIAGDIAVADAAVSGWVTARASALTWALPIAGAGFVLLMGRIIQRWSGKRDEAHSVKGKEPGAGLVKAILKELGLTKP